MIVVSFVAALALAGLALFSPRSRVVLWTAAGLSVLYVLGLTLAVFAGDDYTQSGTNWSNRTTQTHVIYLVAAAIGAAFAVLFGLAATGKTKVVGRGLLLAAGLVGFVAAWIVALAFLAN